MADPALINQAALLAQANATLAAIQLPTGLTLSGDPFVNAEGQVLVPVADEVRMVTRAVSLESLTGPSGSRLVMPPTLRGETAAAVQASRPVASGGVCTTYDDSLNLSFDPTNPQNLDEILRQLASCDPTQAHQAFEALTYMREHGLVSEGDVTAAKERILAERGQAEADAVESNYEAFEEGTYQQPALPQQTNQGQGGGAQGAPGNPAPSGGGASRGGGTALVAGDGPSLPVVAVGLNGEAVSAGFLPSLPEGDLTTVAFLPGLQPANDAGPLPTVRIRREDVEAAVPVPSPFYASPVTVSVQSHQIPEFIGRASGSDPVRFFETLVFPAILSGAAPMPPVVAFLTAAAPETRRFVEAAQRCTADVLRNYWMGACTGSVRDAHRPLSLTYRYAPEARGIVVSVNDRDRAGFSRTEPASLPGESADAEFNPFERIRRFTGMSLASYRIGIDGVRREADISAYPSAVAPTPFDVFSAMARRILDVPAGSAHREGLTDRAPTRIARGGNSGDHRGGEGRDERREGRGHGGRSGHDGRNPEEREDESYPLAEDEGPRVFVA